MKEPRNSSNRALTLQITLSTGLISITAILFALGAPSKREKAAEQMAYRSQLQGAESAGADSITSLGNYPDTSVSLSGNAIVTPDAAPSTTTSINVSTNATFKGTFAASPTTGVVKVTDAHPSGIYTVTVIGFGPGGTTTKTFTLTVTSTACSANLTAGFINAADVTVFDRPVSVAIGDFNGDGKQDLAVANQNSDRVSIRLGDGLGGFSGSTAFFVPSSPISVAIGDFNGDGKQDLAVVSYNISGKVSIRLGDGLGGFSGSTDLGVGSYPYSVAIGDFNGDGRQDLAVANTNGCCSPSTVSIRLGNGLGGFSSSTDVNVGSNPRSVAIGDFNGDGKQDLAVTNITDDTVSIRLGDGLGGFSGSTFASVGSGPMSVAIGDFNGDGKQDLAVTQSGSATVAIRLGDGLGGFSGSTFTGVGTGPISVAIGDFNGEGKQDLAVANFSSTDTVSIRLGDGSGNFSGSTEVYAGFHPQSVAIGDFNGDGRQDLAVANSGSTKISIRLGQCVTPPTPTPSPSCASVITQSTSQAITSTFGPCLNPHPMPPDGYSHYDNNYFRAFDMADFVAGSPYYVSAVSFGVYSANHTQPVTIRLYTNAGASFPGGTRTQIASTTISVTSAQSGTVVTTPLAATVPAGTSQLVMELFTPNGASGPYVFFVGANSEPETGLSYWSCASFSPTKVNAHFVFNVYGSCTPFCETLLYDQTSNAATTAIVSQNFEPANDGFDSQVADDFIVPPGQTWTIQRVNVPGLYFDGPGPAASVNVTFYFNSGTLPGVAVPGGSYTNLSMADTAGNFSIPLPSNLVLTSGTHWVSVQANMDYSSAGEWGSLERTVQFTSPAAWQNPAGSFGFGCLTWGARGVTCGFNPTAPDQLFQIVGCLAGPSPAPINISGAISYCSNPVPGPVSNVTLALTGSMSDSTLSDGSGNYTLSSLPFGGTYTVTPTKAALPPGSTGINTVDVLAAQKQFLGLGTPLSGCRLAAADVNGDSAVSTVDVIAIQRFFFFLSTGVANVGKYQFNPISRTYPGLVSGQGAQNYGTLVFGDVVAPFVE